MIKFDIKNAQQARDQLDKALRDYMTNKFVTVGVHEDDNARPDDTSINNATLGAIQHFGNDNIPPRPWLDVGVASGKAEYLEIIAENPNDPELALQQVGVTAVGYVQQYMTDLSEPPNAASTIKAKGSANPLIDTGLLRQSVTFTVTTGKPTEGVG